MNLGPKKSSNLAVVNSDKELLWVKPSFLDCFFKITHRPISLVGVAREEEVLEINVDVDGHAEAFRSLCCKLTQN